jgi:hypothetical protein
MRQTPSTRSALTLSLTHALTLTAAHARTRHSIKKHVIRKSRGAPTSLSQFGGFVQFVTEQGGEQGGENRAGALSVQLSLVPYA